MDRASSLTLAHSAEAGLPATNRAQAHVRSVRPGSALTTLAVIAALLAAWETWVRVAGTPSYVLPPPTSVVDAGLENHALLLENARVTLLEMLAGATLAVVAGILVAIPLASSRRVRDAAYPLLTAFEGMPKIAFAPLLVVWVGIGFESKVTLAVLVAFYPIVITMTRALRMVDENLMEFLRLLGVGQLRVLVQVQARNALPAVFDSFRLAVPLAMIGVLIGEFIASAGGLGFVLLQSTANLDLPLAFAALVTVGLLVGLTQPLIAAAERRALRWLPERQR